MCAWVPETIASFYSLRIKMFPFCTVITGSISVILVGERQVWSFMFPQEEFFIYSMFSNSSQSLTIRAFALCQVWLALLGNTPVSSLSFAFLCINLLCFQLLSTNGFTHEAKDVLSSVVWMPCLLLYFYDMIETLKVSSLAIISSPHKALEVFSGPENEMF